MALTERLAVLIETNVGKAKQDLGGLATVTQKAADKAKLLTARAHDLDERLKRNPGSKTLAAQLQIAQREAAGATQKLKHLEGQSDRSGRGLSRLGLSSKMSGDALKASLAAGAAVAGVALVKMVSSGIKSFIDLADKVRMVQRVTGASAEDASRLVAAFDDLNVSAEQGAGAFGKLLKTLGANPAALNKFGVAIAHTKDGSVDAVGTLGNLSDAYIATRDPAQRAALVMAAFGKSGQALVPVLEQGSKALRDLYATAAGDHQLLSQKDLDQAKAYKLAVNNLGDAFQGLSRNLGTTLLPVVEGGVHLLTSAAQAVDSVLSAIKVMDPAVLHAAGSFAAFAGGGIVLSKILDKIGGTNVGKAFKNAEGAAGKTKAGFGALAGSVSPLTAGVAVLGAAFAANNYTQAKNKDTTKALVAAYLQGGDAAKATAVNLGYLNDLIGQGGEAAHLGRKSLNDFNKELDRQQASAGAAGRATQAVEKAERALADAVAGGTASSGELKSATDNLANAKAKQKKITDALTKATEDQTAAQDAQRESEIASFSSVIGFARAQNALRDSTDDLAAKEKALAAARKEHGPGSEEARQAAKDLRDAQLSLRESVLGVAAAHVQAAKDAAAAKGLTLSSSQATDIYRAELEKLANGLSPKSPLRTYLRGLIHDLDTAGRPRVAKITVVTAVSNERRADRGLPGRASGGPVTAGQPYMVGERGPELFLPSRSGRILPDGAGRAVVNNFHFPNYHGDKAELVRMIERAMGGRSSDLLRAG